MKCEFHPNVNADANCNNCSTPICGICSRFVDGDVLCEKCESFSSLSNLIEHRLDAKSGKMDTLLSNAESHPDSPKQTNTKVDRSPASKEKIQLGVVIFCCLLITFQISQMLSANSPLTIEEIQAEETRLFQIETCMMVFWEIASHLANGEEPDENLRCEDTGLPMIVGRENGDIRISHPRPDFLGLTDIYITRSNPVPILVE